MTGETGDHRRMDDQGPQSESRSTKRRDRILAVCIGLALAVIVLGAEGYWQSSYVEGQEACTACERRRDVDRRGPFWFRSEPFAVRSTPRPISACSGHSWVKVGCWRQDGGLAYHSWSVAGR